MKLLNRFAACFLVLIITVFAAGKTSALYTSEFENAKKFNQHLQNSREQSTVSTEVEKEVYDLLGEDYQKQFMTVTAENLAVTLLLGVGITAVYCAPIVLYSAVTQKKKRSIIRAGLIIAGYFLVMLIPILILLLKIGCESMLLPIVLYGSMLNYFLLFSWRKADSTHSGKPSGKTNAYCRRCGAALPEQSAFCNKCGTEVVEITGSGERAGV